MYHFGQRLRNKIVKSAQQNKPSKKLQPGRIVIVSKGPFKDCIGRLNSISNDGLEAVVEGVNTEIVSNQETNYMERKVSRPIPFAFLKSYSVEHNSPTQKIIKVIHPLSGKVALIDERSAGMHISKVTDFTTQTDEAKWQTHHRHKVLTRREFLEKENRNLLLEESFCPDSTTEIAEAERKTYKASIDENPIPSNCIL